jgi:putative transposase
MHGTLPTVAIRNLLKFGKDRQGWIVWLFEAKKRYGTVILNYTCTRITFISSFMTGWGSGHPQEHSLAAGRTAQEYNQRKHRKGAYRKDRSHATAVQTDRHLVQCLVCMDMNMVRAGMIEHPSSYSHSGYGEIQNPPER